MQILFQLFSCFQATFLFALLLFWLCIFHGLRQTERGLYSFYLPKFLLVGTMWFSGVIIAVLQETNELRDPSFSYQVNDISIKSNKNIDGFLFIYLNTIANKFFNYFLFNTHFYSLIQHTTPTFNFTSYQCSQCTFSTYFTWLSEHLESLEQ